MNSIPQLTITEGVQKFIKYFQQEDLSRRTIHGYAYDLKCFMIWIQELKGLQMRCYQLTPQDCMTYRNYMFRVARYKGTTINRRIEALKRFLRWAEYKKLIQYPIEIKTMHIARKRRPKGLTVQEVKVLLQAAQESRNGMAKRNYALIQLFIQTGLRLSEIPQLCIQDVTIQSRTGNLRIQSIKERKERIIPLNLAVRKALRDYLETRKPLQKKDPLFISTKGKTFTLHEIQSVIQKLSQAAKITRLRVSAEHLRHTFALRYLNRNPDQIVELSHLLGHDSLETTTFYSQPSETDFAQALARSPMNLYG